MVYCIIVSLLFINGSFSIVRVEKPFDSMGECRHWVHQQEFMYSIPPVVGTTWTCVQDT